LQVPCSSKRGTEPPNGGKEKEMESEEILENKLSWRQKRRDNPPARKNRAEKNLKNKANRKKQQECPVHHLGISKKDSPTSSPREGRLPRLLEQGPRGVKTWAPFFVARKRPRVPCRMGGVENSSIFGQTQHSLEILYKSNREKRGKSAPRFSLEERALCLSTRTRKKGEPQCLLGAAGRTHPKRREKKEVRQIAQGQEVVLHRAERCTWQRSARSHQKSAVPWLLVSSSTPSWGKEITSALS